MQDSKISAFITKVFNIPHRIFAFPYKTKTDQRGVIYASQFLRTTSILLDLTILLVILQAFTYLAINVFAITVPIEAIEKFKLGIELSKEENILLYSYPKKMFAIQIAQLVLVGFFVIFMWHKFGGTPGKLLFKMRVIDDATLKSPSISSCFKRFFMFPISVLCLFLGMIWPLFDKKARTWHDIASGTIVVLKKSIAT